MQGDSQMANRLDGEIAAGVSRRGANLSYPSHTSTILPKFALVSM